MIKFDLPEDIKKYQQIIGKYAEEFIKNVKPGHNYEGINWGDFSVHDTFVKINDRGNLTYEVHCEEADYSYEFVNDMYNFLVEKTGIKDIEVRLEW